MDDIISSTITEIFSLIKGKEYQEAQKKINEGLDKLIKEEAKDRMLKTDEIIKNIMQLDISIAKIENEYKKIQTECPNTILEGIERYIKELKQRRSKLVSIKKEINRKKAKQ